MVRLSLSEFGDATLRMLDASGVHKTRLMLRLKPNGSKLKRRVFLKSTDNTTTLTSYCVSKDDMKVLENVVNAFVTRCTIASVKAAESVSVAGGAGGNAAATSTKGAGNVAAATSTNSPAAAKKDDGKQQQQKQQQQKSGCGGAANNKKKGGKK